MMRVIYAGERFPPSFSRAIFLAGPTPRSPKVASWRPKALRLLKKAGYDGVIFNPEARDGQYKRDYLNQVEWEKEGLNLADCILFWVPRNLKTLPGFTTNIEWGIWARSGKVVLGAPAKAAKLRYLRWMADYLKILQAKSLSGTVKNALSVIGDGYLRTDGERYVPLYIWRKISFQSWYQNQKKVGNRLDRVKVEWVFRVGPDKKFIFFWVLHVDVFIAKENRHKINEVVVGRPDIAAVVMYQPAKNWLDSKIVLIREFRSPVATADGYVWEIPSGSSSKLLADNPKLAVEEVHEETGLRIDLNRVRFHSVRQLVATMSAHRAYVYSVEINDYEIEWLLKQANVPHGVVGATERTYVEIRTAREILANQLLDWSNIGMILSVLLETNKV
jgi:8-oxo-dGTP pyrophosphatase MutT (NUDIX family)